MNTKKKKKKKGSQSPKANKSKEQADDASVSPPTRSDNIRLTPLMIAAQQNDLKGCCAGLAEIGVQIEEAARLESPEAACDAPPRRDGNEPGSARKRASKKQNKNDNDESESQKYSAANLLKKQANELVQDANSKWGEALHKAENVFNKSNRIIAYLTESRDKWPTEMKITGIEMSQSTGLSHFFNTQYGINEKVPQLAEWLTKNCSFTSHTNQIQKPQ